MANNEAKVKFTAEYKELQEGIKKANSDIKSMRSELKLNETQFQNTGNKTEYLSKKHQTLSSMLVENANKQDALNKQLELAQKAEDTTQIEKLKVSLTYAKIEEENLKTKIDECNSELQKQKQAEAELQSPLGKLNTTIEKQKSELEDLKTQYKNVAVAKGTNSKEAKELKSKIDSLNGELSENERELKKVENAAEATGSAMKDSANGGWTVFKGVVSNIATDALRKAGDVIKDFAGDVVETGKGFDTAMSQVAATMGTNVNSISDMKDKAKEMGAATEWTATESAEAMNYLALAGYSAEQACSTLPTVLNLASAGAMDLSSASDMVTDAMTALGIEADLDGKNITVFGDKMAKTASKSNTSVSQLGEAILTVGGTAKMMSGGTTELNAALGILADNSIKGSEGGTKLRNILLAMTPTTDKAEAAWKELGVSAYDANGEMRPLKDTFADLSTAMKGMSSEKKTRLISAMFNKGDIRTANALLATSSKRWDELSTAINDSGGAMADMAATQLDNLNGDLTLMDSAMDGLKQTVYDEFESTLRNGVQYITDTVIPVIKDDVIPALKEAMEWLKEHKTLIAVVAGVIGVITTAIIAYNAMQALGAACNAAHTTSLGGLIAAKWAEVAANTSVAATGWAAIAPILAIIAVIAVVIAIIVLCVKHWDEIKAAINRFVDSAKEKMSDFVDKIKEKFNSIKEKINNIIESVKDKVSAMKESVRNKFEELKAKIVGVVDNVRDKFKAVVDFFKNNWKELLLLIVNPFAGAFALLYKHNDNFREKVNDLKNKIVNIFTSLKEKISDKITSIKDKVKSIATGIKSTVVGIVNNIIRAIEHCVNKVVRGVNTIINGINKVVSKAGKVVGLDVAIPTLSEVSLPRVALASGGVAYKPISALIGEGGEAEAVAPISVLRKYIQDAVDVSMSTMVIIDYVQLAKAMAQMESVIKVDNRELGRVVRSV